MVKFIGAKYVDYVSKRTQKEVKGYNLYFIESDVPGVSGLCCFESYVSTDVYDKYFSGLKYDDCVTLLYNRFGNVVGCIKPLK